MNDRTDKSGPNGADRTLPDSIAAGMVERAPGGLRPYMRLARWDRPVGAWLLAIPGLLGVAFAGMRSGYAWSDPVLLLLLGIGAFVMRGAGCTYNDIVDRDLDARVARTADRPLVSGAVSIKQAWIFVAAQCLVGLLILLMLPVGAQLIALLSIPLVLAYPFAKRLTWWPQIWLGFTFNWPFLVGYAAGTDRIDGPSILFYAALILWTLGYDTIYALQDREDDQLAGVKSSALALGSHAREGVALFYGASAALAAFAVAMASSPYGAAAAIGYTLHLSWQIHRLEPDNVGRNLALFRSNRDAGLLLFAGVVAAALVSAWRAGEPLIRIFG